MNKTTQIIVLVAAIAVIILVVYYFMFKKDKVVTITKDGKEVIVYVPKWGPRSTAVISANNLELTSGALGGPMLGND